MPGESPEELEALGELLTSKANRSALYIVPWNEETTDSEKRCPKCSILYFNGTFSTKKVSCYHPLSDERDIQFYIGCAFLNDEFTAISSNLIPSNGNIANLAFITLLAHLLIALLL